MSRSPKMVSPFFVPVIGLMFGFLAGWITAAVIGVGVIVWYGLTGEILDIRPIAPRVPAFVAAVVFLSTTISGWFALARAALKDRA